MRIKHAVALVVAAVLLVSAGCAEKRSDICELQMSDRAFSQPFTEVTAIPAVQTEFPEYRLNIGDMLEIIYHVKHLVMEENYRLLTEDIISIHFPYHPEFNQTVTIPPDGKVGLLLIGQVDTYTKDREEHEDESRRVRLGKTVMELEEELVKKYKKFFKDGELTITFEAANTKIEELKRAITTAPRGQSRLMPIKPDGNITLPFITDIRAYGKTIEELHKDLNEKYKEAGIPELEVTVQILTVAPRKIFVLGEVVEPGLKTVDNMITLSQVVAMAGGLRIRRADKNNVLVVRRKGLAVPQGVLVDLEKILNPFVKDEDGKMQISSKVLMKDFWLEDYDVVYIPSNNTTKRTDWINQVFTKGIYSVLPFSTGVGMSFGYEIRADNP